MRRSWLLSFSFVALMLGCGSNEDSTTTAATDADTSARKVLVCLGDSITAGYGLDPDEAYPALLQQKCDAADAAWRVVAAGVSGDTTAGGLRRLDWAFRSGVDAILIALGGNDGLRGIAPAAVKQNLEAIVDAARAKNPAVIVVIAGMQAPPNMGATYCEAFERVFADVATATDAKLVPFLLEGVAGDRTLNQPDGIHPTADGQRIIADQLWETIRDSLQ